jgi:hypothetical protein
MILCIGSVLVRSWHFSELAIPRCDVCSWWKSGSGQQWDEPDAITHS